ncbi:myristylated protein, essential for entry/fusion (Cop-A16L) [Mythimna separata entomopoxvirus 'L']|uniref:Myristylated protein, essential for entry/fusion (Cop-A16L) n=1 Tax=Mythimna separata entomopoxvirus 'L' TaxID=1293572 RepID=A0A916KQ84_9POXV|nr:myristylated protein, essential for entry/fusion (Cop-A16L) [Mythimna separata entomopoxvirus 'L']CCU56329.1 myristylated protein, essential for entry/fusion (Cop-A16L) [Mythimna separata entomopoxvirus 'L']
MGGKVSLSYIRAENNNSGSKNLLIGLSDDNIIRVSMFEQINRIPKSEYLNKEEYEINYCIGSPYNSLEECALLFNTSNIQGYTSELNNYVVTNEGSPCTSLTFRPGSILYGDSEWLDGRTFTGNRCKIIYRGFPIYENDLYECCTGKRITGCHETLINNFTTSHCNVTMQSYCASNPEDVYCYRWLNSQSKSYDVALKLYSDLCSIDHTKLYCDYMCIYARENGFAGYCDKSLINWCSRNSNNPLCYCYIPPSSIIPDVEEVLGPKECWLAPCTVSYNGQKWLTTEQMNIKKNCSIQSCIITIGSLIARGNNKIDLINNCINNLNANTTSGSDTTDITNINIQQTWGVFFDPIILLLLICLFVLLILYNYNTKPIHTVKINEDKL